MSQDDIPEVDDGNNVVSMPRQFVDQEQVQRSPEDIEFEALMKTLSVGYEKVTLPSRGLFYNGRLPGGKINVRPMTLKEEKFLATPRLIKSGKAVDLIFSSCIQEKVEPEDLLSIDRNFLLIWLRGISYGSEYDVKMKCPNCSMVFSDTVNLDQLKVDEAPEDLAEPMRDVFPKTQIPFEYRLQRGKDESFLTNRRDKKVREFGSEASEDSAQERDVLLVMSIKGFTDKSKIRRILQSLSMEDISYLRSKFRHPGFGVDTDLHNICPSCQSEFSIPLPMDANFFFPEVSKKK